MYNPYYTNSDNVSYSPYKNDDTTISGYNVPTNNSNSTI